MKTKTGPCLDCPPGSAPRPLIAGRCQSHYWKHRQKINGKKPSAKEKQAQKDALALWFDRHLKTRPSCCENCGEPLGESMVINPRAIVCHIVKKSLFPEVATRRHNRWYGCNACHTLYDNGSAEDVSRMPVMYLVRMRFTSFAHQIAPASRYMVPEYLKNLLPDEH